MADSYDSVVERVARLSKRQREILELVLECGTSKLIAARIGIEPESVDKSLQRAMRTLGAPNRAVAAAMLREHQIVASGKPDGNDPAVPVSGSCPVGDPELPPSSGPDRDTGATALFEVRQPYIASRPSKGGILYRLVFEPGERRDLTFGQKLRHILVWFLVGIAAVSLLGAVLAEIARTAHDLLPAGPT